MNTNPDPKQDQSNASGGAQQSAYPLDSYTVAPQSKEGDGEKSPYYKSSAPSISMPKGGGALKGIDEKFTVNAVNGTSSLQVPLPLTPGRGGFTPGLSLDYNSGAGNSEFGLGWGLGLPAIQRRTDKKLPRYNDADESDVFVMAGAEDLVPLMLEVSGNWVRDIVTDGDYTLKRYRPRIEGLWARIEHVTKQGAGGNWWKVTTKENMVTYYGLTAAGRISDPEDEERIFKWLPQLSFDNKGNVQQYFYKGEDDANVILSAHENNRLNGIAAFTNTYLKSVAYCNKNPFTPDSNYQPTLPDKPEGKIGIAKTLDAGYLMQAVLDYGDHDADTPAPYDTLPVWPCRKDPFSGFNAGFEIRTYRKCRRVLMFHYFDEIFDGAADTLPDYLVRSCLVRSLEFTYLHDGGDALTEADYITTITRKGHILKSDGSYISKALPPMTMTYQPLVWNGTVHDVSPEDMQNAPQGLTGPYQWIDLWGEGLPGILTEQGHGWFYKQNLGDGHFSPALSIAPKPSFQGLGSNMQWHDLEADGRRQLVSTDPAMPGYFELDDDQEWQPFRNFTEWVNVDWSSPYTKMLDLDGDGRADLLITEERAWRWYENEGKDGYTDGGYFSPGYDEEKGPRLLLNDMVQSIFLADMNGDGMTDIVRIKNGEVCYWPNMGYGRFGAKVAMSNAPVFDTPDIFNPIYITLADISGTGAPDLIYLGYNKCTAWINLAGNGWGEATDIFPLPGIDPESKITVTDFLGNGTACIVWSSPLPQYAHAPMRYIDLMGGNKPYLMMSHHNGMGKTTAVTYKQSTKYYLEDMRAGTPWATRLPFAVHCVASVTTSDSVSETTYTQLYSYHHGYYDHEEREFRGFGRVDTIDTDTAVGFDSDGITENDLDQYPVLTRTWNHTGAWMREGTLLEAFATEYYPIDGGELPLAPHLTDTLSPQEQREAYRALKGQPLRQEVYALDATPLQGIPYSIATHAYCVTRVQPVEDNRYASFYSYQRESLAWSAERNVADPRIAHQLTLEVDDYGNVLTAATVAYPRRADQIPVDTPTVVADVQQRMLATCTVNAYTNDVLTGGYHLRVPYEAKNYELTGLTPPTGIWAFDDLLAEIKAATEIDYTDIPTTGVQMRLLSHARTLYQSNDTATVLDLGVIESLALSYNQYQLAFTDGIINGGDYYNGWVNHTMLTEGAYLCENDIVQFASTEARRYWLPGGTTDLDTAHFYVPTVFYDPWGNTTAVTYWDDGGDNYYLLPQTTTDAVGNVTTVNAYNWYNLQPAHITDINDNEGKVVYDALGMAVAAAMMSKDGSVEGDTIAGIDPNDSTDLANQAAFFTDPESVAADLLQGATWRCVYDLSATPVAVGMIARELHNSEDPDSPVLIRLTYTDGMGRTAMHKVQAAPAEGDTATRWIGNGKAIYNNKGAVVMQYEPYFTDTPLFDDAEYAATHGVSPRMHYDALGRAVRTDMPDGTFTKVEWDAWKQATYDNNDTVDDSQWYARRTGSGDLAGIPEEADAATKAHEHYNTPNIVHLDTLARPFYNIQHDRYPDSSTWTDHFYESYTVLDIAGDRMEVHDARGLMPQAYKYNMLKAIVKQVSMDSGSQLILVDVMGQPLYSLDAENSTFHFTYDALRRQEIKEITPSGGSAKKTEVMQYGEGVTDDKLHNLRGQLHAVYDGTGRKEIPEYNFKGHPISTAEQLLTDYTIADVDWYGTPALNTETFTTSINYDAFDRPVTSTDPGNNVTRHEYDKSGALFAVYLTPNGDSETAYVTETYHNAKGQREKIYYGNGTNTAYTYDPLTYRLTRLLTRKNTDVFQDLNYWYDPVGNITMVRDDAQRALYFNNAITLPEQDYTYDALYRLIRATGREQIGTATFGSTDNYNDAPWMGISHKGDDNSTQNYIQKYAYDGVGNIQSLQHIADAGSYTRTYIYDGASNRLMKTNVGSDTYSYDYDARGNMITMPHLASMDWNAHNQLSSVGLGGGGNAYYQYSSGERTRKVIEKGVIVEERIYLGSFEIYRKYISGVLDVERTTVHVSDDAVRIAMLEVRTAGSDGSVASLIRYVYSNHLSTATLELDDKAQIISYEEYHPYGTTSYQAMDAGIKAVAKRYRYTGKERDEESGLYYMSARYYAPWLARWIAVDFLETKLTPASPYIYTSNNPVMLMDPTGKEPETSTGGGTGGGTGEGGTTGSGTGEGGTGDDKDTNSSSNDGSGGGGDGDSSDNNSVEEVFLDADGNVVRDFSRERREDEQGKDENGNWKIIKITHHAKKDEDDTDSSGGGGSSSSSRRSQATDKSPTDSPYQLSYSATFPAQTLNLTNGDYITGHTNSPIGSRFAPDEPSSIIGISRRIFRDDNSTGSVGLQVTHLKPDELESGLYFGSGYNLVGPSFSFNYKSDNKRISATTTASAGGMFSTPEYRRPDKTYLKYDSLIPGSDTNKYELVGMGVGISVELDYKLNKFISVYQGVVTQLSKTRPLRATDGTSEQWTFFTYAMYFGIRMALRTYLSRSHR